MSKQHKMGIVRDRNQKYRRWSPLVKYDVHQFDLEKGIVDQYQNHLVTVFIKRSETDGFLGMTGLGKKIDKPVIVYEMILKWTDINRRDPVPYSMRMLCRDEIFGPNCEACELYPARYREVKSELTHVWVFGPDFMLPFGLIPDDLGKRLTDDDSVVSQADVEAFVVRHSGGIVEVFADESECKAMYGEKTIPELSTKGVELLHNVEPPCETVAWTPVAIGKMNRLVAISKSAQENGVVPDGMVEDVVGSEEESEAGNDIAEA
jgi:hypothetical protein